MLSVGLCLRLTQRPTGRLGLALAVLCALCLAAPRAEAGAFIDTITPVLRADLGATWRAQPEGLQPALLLNLNAGIAKTPVNNALIVVGEIGYSYAHQHTHAFTAGAGVGAGLPLISSVYVIPRLVVGSDDGQRAIGMRTGLAGMFFADVFTLEVAHQFLSTDSGLRHEVQLSIGVNIGTAVAETLA